MRTRITLKLYIFILCTVYFSLLYLFYGRLQVEINQSLDDVYTNKLLYQISKTSDISPNPRWQPHDVAEMKRRMLKSEMDDIGFQKQFVLTRNNMVKTNEGVRTTEEVVKEDTCFLSARNSNRTFQHLNQNGLVYSAYLDERQETAFVRIMAIFGNYKKQKLNTVFCHFDVEKELSKQVLVQGSLYELCENHGKKYGGFIVSCPVPDNITSLCTIGVYQKTIQGKTMVKLPVTRLESKRVVHLRKKMLSEQRKSNLTTQSGAAFNNTKVPTSHVPYNYTICVPPLFGNLGTMQFVEFVEVHRILGFQHFIFYVERVLNPEILKVLKLYEKLGLVTVIQWHLPINGKNDIWYNGQLNAHNDCMYRAMSLSKYVAIIDIDEAIVPHDGHLHIHESLDVLLKGKSVCALSFYSAFYSLKFAPEGVDSDLISLSHLGRSQQFSNVRTKVMVSPLKIFEVGIHHVSKPLEESYKVLKVNQSIAFLHHYRKCVPNYGMKCANFVEENTMLKYKDVLTENVKDTFWLALSQKVLQINATIIKDSSEQSL